MKYKSKSDNSTQLNTTPTVNDALTRWYQNKQWEKKVEEAEKKASERINEENKGFLNNMRFSGETGEWSRGANLNATMAKYVAEELGLDGNKAFLESYKKDGKRGAVAFGSTLLTAPVAGEFATYGLLGGLSRLAGGTVAGAAGSYGLGKLGDLGDKAFNTKWMGTTGRILGGFAGWPVGSNLSYKGTLNLAAKYPNLFKFGSTNRFVSDVIGNAFGKGVKKFSIPLTDLQRNIESGKIGWGPSTTQILWHNSNEPLSQLKVNFPAWDVINRNAPLGHVWLTKRETINGFLGDRPYHLRGNVTLSKPMVQIGEAIGNGKNTTRNQILDFAQKSSADGIYFQDIADNTLKNQDVYAVFKNVDIKPKSLEASLPYEGYGKVSLIMPNKPKYISTYHFDSRVKQFRPLSEFEKNGKYTLDELHQMGFKLPRKHLQGDNAVQMFKEYGTQYPETTRLYRATGTSGNFIPSPDGTAEFAGQWFTNDPNKIWSYGENAFREARRAGVENPIELQVVDIPTSQLEKFRAKNIIGDRKGVEFEPEDFIIPLETPRGKAPLNLTGNQLIDQKAGLPQIPIQDTPLMQQFRHLSLAERLGIPKYLRSNPKALEDPYYWGYQQWNQRYNTAVESGNIEEAQRLRDLHFKIKAPNAPQYNFYHGTFNKERPFYIFEPQSNNELFFHFSPYKDTAEKFMGIAKTRNENGRLITAKLNIQHPTMVTDSGWWNWYRIPEANPRISKTLGMDGPTAGQYYSDLLFKEPSVSEANGKMMDMINTDAFMYKNYTEDTGRISVAVPRPSQIKLADPVTKTNTGEIIPIVKRDNFHNPDIRYKQGGILKRKY